MNGDMKNKIIYNIVRIVVLLVASGVLIYTSYSLTDSYLNYQDDEAKYAEINDLLRQNNDGQYDNDGNSSDADNKDELNYSAESDEWHWDYDALLKYNNEVRGYIKLDGTRIQYPIVEHSDNDFYLDRGFDRISNGSGSIFVDYRTAGLDGDLCILYGHNMLDGTMFKDLMNFRKKDFCKKHQTFDIYIGHRHYIYYVFAVFSAKATDENIYKYSFDSDYDFQSWINRVYSRSSYRFDNGKPDTSDRIIMCSTCIDDDGARQLVCMYRGEEVVD